MRKFFLGFFLISQLMVLAQAKGLVGDENGKSLGYVNVQVAGKNIWTTSELDGTFEIAAKEGDTLILSCIGYKTLEITDWDQSLVMEAETYKLDEIVLNGKAKKRQKQELGDHKGGVRYFISGTLAKFFPASPVYPFLKAVRFHSDSEIDGAKIQLRILSVVNGKPGSDLVSGRIVSVKKGGRNTSVDLSAENISVPPEGFFIVLENLRIAENYFQEEIKADFGGTRKTWTRRTYSPSFGYLPSDRNDTWLFNGRDWSQRPKERLKDPDAFSEMLMRKYHDHYLSLALSIVLTD